MLKIISVFSVLVIVSVIWAKPSAKVGLDEVFSIENPTYISLGLTPAMTREQRQEVIRLFTKRVLTVPAVQKIRSQISESQRAQFDSCLSSKKWSWPVEAIAHICSVAGPDVIDKLSWIMAPLGDRGVRMVVSNKKEGFAVAASTGANKRPSKATESGRPDYSPMWWLIDQHCREDDGSGVERVMLPIEDWPSEIRRRAEQVKGNNSGALSLTLETDISKDPDAERLRSMLSSLNISSKSAKLIADLSGFIPVPRLCVECPAGYRSNGHDDCIKGECGLIKRCPPKICPNGEVKYNGQCITSCETHCARVQRRLDMVLAEVDSYILPSSSTRRFSVGVPKAHAGVVLSPDPRAFAPRDLERLRNDALMFVAGQTTYVERAKASCSATPELNRCEALGVDAFDVLNYLTLAIINGCGKGFAYIGDRCQPTSCVHCIPEVMFPYQGSPLYPGCTFEETAAALQVIRYFRVASNRDNPSCINGQCRIQPVTESEVGAVLRMNGFSCPLIVPPTASRAKSAPPAPGGGPAGVAGE